MKVIRYENGRNYLPTYAAILRDGRIISNGRTSPSGARRDGEFEIALECQKSDEARLAMILARLYKEQTK